MDGDIPQLSFNVYQRVDLFEEEKMTGVHGISMDFLQQTKLFSKDRKVWKYPKRVSWDQFPTRY